MWYLSSLLQITFDKAYHKEIENIVTAYFQESDC